MKESYLYLGEHGMVIKSQTASDKPIFYTLLGMVSTI